MSEPIVLEGLAAVAAFIVAFGAGVILGVWVKR